MARAESSTALANVLPRTVSALARTMSDSRWSSDARTLLPAAPAFDGFAACFPGGSELSGEVAWGRDAPPAPESDKLAACGRDGAGSTRIAESARDWGDEMAAVSDGVVPAPARLRHARSPTLTSTATPRTTALATAALRADLRSGARGGGSARATRVGVTAATRVGGVTTVERASPGPMASIKARANSGAVA